MPYTTSVRTSDLGLGAGYALWGFRAAAIGHAECIALTKGYREMFGDYAPSALGGVKALAREIGTAGGRRVNVACPGCGCVTADELSIVGLLSAAQSKDDALCDAHLAWLMCGRGEAPARHAALAIGVVFNAAGFQIVRPDIEFAKPPKTTPIISFYSTGNA